MIIRVRHALALVLLSTFTLVAWGDSLPQHAADQIVALMQEKAARTPAQKKISSQLLFATKMKHGLPIAPGVPTLAVLLKKDKSDRVLIDINLQIKPTAIVLGIIKQLGGYVVYASDQGITVRAYLPLDAIETLAARPEVVFIRPAVPAQTRGAVGNFRRQPVTNVVNVSEGVTAHRVDVARATYGATGLGVKVGVLSDSVDFLDQVTASGDLPPVTVLTGQSGVPATGEGTAMLEIVHDVAPDAQLFFASAFNGEVSFANNIRALRAAGCDIIVDDVFYFNESPFQDGPIAQAVNDVTTSGAMYFSSAGNDGNVLSSTAGTWQGNFADSLTTLPGIGGVTPHIHSFGSANNDPVSAQTTGSSGAVLFWSDPLGASSNDYDLYVFDTTLTSIVASSTDTQNGSSDPFETVPINADNNQRLVIVKNGGAADRFLHLALIGGKLGIFTTGNTKGHSAAASAIGVSAAQVPGGSAAFSNTSGLEFFTSDGPRRMFYTPTGALLNTGNSSLLADGGIVLQKPDLTAADGVSTATPGFLPFFGTSAAAPHAAAIAALLKAAVPTATNAQIKNALFASAIDPVSTPPGWDITAGAGIVMADTALAALGASPAPILNLGTVTATPVVGNATIEPGDTVSMTVFLSNSGPATATSVQATLSTTAVGVTLNSASSNYPNLSTSGGSVGVTPFNFTLSSSFPCGAPINFTLTVNTAQGGPKLFSFAVTTGGPLGSVVTTSYAGAPVAIPDGDPTGVKVPLVVSGITGRIGDINFRFGGTSCSTASGSTTVGLDHTWVGDLIIDLISPSGTSVNLIFRLGNGNNSGHNFCNTVLDDSAPTSVQSLATLDAPFTGTFKPASPLAIFKDEDANGTWYLRVRDVAPVDSGSVRAFSLDITPKTCCPAITVNPASLPGGTRGTMYSQNITATGGTGSYTFTRTSGSLPPGLTLSSGGVLSGTPPTAGTGTFTVTAVDGNGCAGTRGYTVTIAGITPPTITNINPNQGGTNTRVLITGTNFVSPTVAFNGTTAAATLLSPTQIRAIVPAGATTGPITVTTIDGVATSATFTIVVQTQRTFVSTAGSDANVCTLLSPCRNWLRALSLTQYGGDVVALKSGGYGPVTIDKTVSITAPTGVYAGITANAGEGVTITAQPGDVVTLRGLTINGVTGATNGVSIAGGAVLQLDAVVINGFSTAVSIQDAERVHMSDAIVRNCGTGLSITALGSNQTFVVVENSRIEANTTGVSAGRGARVTMRRTQVPGNQTGVLLAPLVNGSELSMDRCTISGNATGVSVDGSSASAIVRLSRTTISNNTTSILMTGGGTVVSLGNNTVDGVTSPAIIPAK